MSTPTKVCPRCKQEFPLTPEFWHKCKSRYDGYQSHCRICKLEGNRQSYRRHAEKIIKRTNQYQKDHPDKTREKQKRWRNTHPEKSRESSRKWYWKNHDKAMEDGRTYRKNNPQKVLESSRRWYRANSKRARAYSQQWRKQYPEKVKEQSRRWRQENPKKVVAYSQHRRALKAKAEGSYTTTHIQALYEFQGGRCFHCDCDISEGYHIDHWIPLSRGGSNWPENLRLLCPSCNTSKSNKLPHEWDNRYCP